MSTIPPPTPPTGRLNVTTLLRAAWLAVLLGIFMQLIVTGINALGGGTIGLRTLADLMQRISWSTLVCVGLAVGTSLSVAPTEIGGILGGLIAAPGSFVIARTANAVVSKALKVTGSTVPMTLLITVLILKALQYAALGYVIARIARNRSVSVKHYLAAGAGAGCVFGGAAIAATYLLSAAPPTPIALISIAANELLFPIGCSLVLFTTNVLTRRGGAAPVGAD